MPSYGFLREEVIKVEKTGMEKRRKKNGSHPLSSQRFTREKKRGRVERELVLDPTRHRSIEDQMPMGGVREFSESTLWKSSMGWGKGENPGEKKENLGRRRKSARLKRIPMKMTYLRGFPGRVG